MVAAVLAMQADLAHFHRQRIIVGKARTAVAVAAKRLRGEETGAPYGREGARFLATIAGTEALAAILDHRKGVFGSHSVDSVEVCTLPVETDWHDSLCADRDSCLDLGRIYIESVSVYINKDRRSSQKGDHLAGRDEGEGGGDDLVTNAYAQRHQGYHQGIGAACDRYAVARSRILREFSFQFANLGPHDVLPV